MKTVKKPEVVLPTLPAGMIASDLKRLLSSLPMKKGESYKRWHAREEKNPLRIVGQFQMYYTEVFGWVICTLQIRGASYRSASTRTARTYGIEVRTGEVVTVGLGPHVKHSVMVYVRLGRQAELQKYLDLHITGEEKANVIRDRISTRRAQGSLNRMNGLTRWTW